VKDGYGHIERLEAEALVVRGLIGSSDVSWNIAEVGMSIFDDEDSQNKLSAGFSQFFAERAFSYVSELSDEDLKELLNEVQKL